MSKQPDEPQFNSGLNQSFRDLSLSGAGAGSPPASPASPARLNKMTIEYKELKFDESKPIGRGAYGVVFEGQFRKNKVAIKVYDFRGKLSVQQQAEVLHEAELMEGLHSDYLIVLRGICLDPRYCLVMEYCEGGTLRGRLDKNDPAINLLDQLRWAKQISYGLYNLHSERIIHRDLKGDNVLLNDRGNAKVADFGLSVMKSSSTSQSKSSGGHQIAGTMPWMAPELFNRKPASTASDIYSLGMVLWEIMSRQKPFAEAIPAVLVGMVLSGKREIIDETWPMVFRTLMQACWDADAAKRPTAQKVGEEFEAALKALESVDRPVSPHVDIKAERKAAVSHPTQSSISLPPSENSQAFMPPPKSELKSVEKLLRFVAEGAQDEAEALLQKSPQLLLNAGEVIDLSGRTFQKITAFQYALWALDWHMWGMIQKYLPREAQINQLQQISEGKGTEHGKHFSIEPMLQVLQQYVDKFNSWTWQERNNHWCKIVGGAQKHLPAHVVNEYCHPNRKFSPCPNFSEETPLPRTRTLKQGVSGDWFSADHRTPFAVVRSHWSTAIACFEKVSTWTVKDDTEALRTLFTTRLQQFESLKSDLLSDAAPASVIQPNF